MQPAQGTAMLNRVLSASLAPVRTQRIAVGGHRGCGENLLAITAAPSLLVEPAQRENTVGSFKRAAALGVSFVEFDVQVTRDGVPVLWHDDQVVTRPAPGAAAIQFEVRDKNSDEFASLVQPSAAGGWQTSVVRTFRNRETRKETDGLTEWMCSQEDVLPTLEQVFQALPESVGFDIEVKMTTPDTVPFTSAEEIERVVNPILACVDAAAPAGSARTIMFSSFDPDICIQLARRQSRFPVMFLSGCGLYKHCDPRRTGIAAAVDVAAQNQLAGVVVPASILIAHPDLVKTAADRNLKVLTYGLENNDVLIVERQADLGVHAVIVDDVESTLPQLTASGVLMSPQLVV